MIMPPSTTMAWPVMKCERSLARNTTTGAVSRSAAPGRYCREHHAVVGGELVRGHARAVLVVLLRPGGRNHRVHGDAVARPFLRDGAGPGHDRALRRGVVSRAA